MGCLEFLVLYSNIPHELDNCSTAKCYTHVCFGCFMFVCLGTSYCHFKVVSLKMHYKLKHVRGKSNSCNLQLFCMHFNTVFTVHCTMNQFVEPTVLALNSFFTYYQLELHMLLVAELITCEEYIQCVYSWFYKLILCMQLVFIDSVVVVCTVRRHHYKNVEIFRS